ncbi:Hypothetical protein CINCED_3A012878 [Cinara cedri]|uniref:Uncharacterized protein n=1 Tax=Cinara cedri TaxID=506608 RepID=A0A5E4MS09_9HEMI|nr:Hypothetical protein CINCED_3A012878 [Cinara cedri]
MSERSIKDFFLANKKTKTIESTESTDVNQAVTSASSSIKGKEKRFYNTKWEIDYPWLYFDKQRNGAFCNVELEKLALVALKNPVYNQIVSQSFEECKINRTNVSHLFRSVYLLVKEEIAHATKYEPLIKRLLMKSSGHFKIGLMQVMIVQHIRVKLQLVCFYVALQKF